MEVITKKQTKQNKRSSSLSSAKSYRCMHDKHREREKEVPAEKEQSNSEGMNGF